MRACSKPNTVHLGALMGYFFKFYVEFLNHFNIFNNCNHRNDHKALCIPEGYWRHWPLYMNSMVELLH